MRRPHPFGSGGPMTGPEVPCVVICPAPLSDEDEFLFRQKIGITHTFQPRIFKNQAIVVF